MFSMQNVANGQYVETPTKNMTMIRYMRHMREDMRYYQEQQRNLKARIENGVIPNRRSNICLMKIELPIFILRKRKR